MRVLILSCNTGGGHNTAAKAVQEVFLAQGDDCIIKDALSFGGQLASDLVCDAYLEMVKRTPKMFGELYRLGERYGKVNNITPDNIRSPVYLVNKLYSDALHEYIQQNDFDAIVCTHIFPTEALTHLKRKHNLTVPFYFVTTDYACPPMLEETLPDKIFSPHEDSLCTYTKQGIPADLVYATGIPVSQKFTVPSNKSEARSKIGLKDDDQAFLMMSGSMGFGDVLDTAADIFNMGNEHTRIVVITGNNKDMYNQFQEKFADETRLILVGFTDQISVYMDACDVLLTKPGGLSTTEALVRGIPLIHTSPIPGCETENAEFFQQHHLSLCADSSKTASILATRLMKDTFLRNQIIEAQKHYKYENSAKAIVDFIKEQKK